MESKASLTIIFLCLTALLAGCGEARKVEGDIVSLSPVVTEILYELGAGGRIMANTKFCNYPEDAKTKIKIGDFLNPNVEKIISLKPKIVIGTSSEKHNPLWKRLEEAGIKVIHFPIDTLDQVIAAYKTTGEAVGLAEKGRELSEKFAAEYDSLKKKYGSARHKPRVLFFVNYPGLWAAGRTSFVDSFIAAVGGDNLVKEEGRDGWVGNFPDERVLRLKPDIIFMSIDGDKLTDELRRRITDHFKYVKARVHLVNADEVCRPGPRALVGWKKIAKILHPEVD